MELIKMANPMIRIHTLDDEIIDREMTAEEFKAYQEQKAIDALPKPLPTPAEKLFAATGLTVAEYKALGL